MMTKEQALEIINHQQEKIERLEKRISDLKHALFEQQSYTADLQRQLKTAESKAIKEFAERLKELYTDESITDDMHCFIRVIKQNIDDISEEMITRKD